VAAAPSLILPPAHWAVGRRDGFETRTALSSNPPALAATGKACESDVKSLCAGKEGHEAMMCLRAAPSRWNSPG
jgi:hypothetical protein